jgi:sulfur relay protein TusB/DsrH
MSSPLHTIGSAAALGRCLTRATADAVLLLIGDAVYCGLTAQDRPLHVLIEDLAARGLSAADLALNVIPVDMKGFVALSVAHSPIIGWS